MCSLRKATWLGRSRATGTKLPFKNGWRSKTLATPAGNVQLSVGYEKAGNVQLAQGDLGGALQSYRDYLEIARKLAEQATDNAVWQNNAAWGRYCVAKVLVRIKGGDRNEARRLTNEGLDIMTRLEHQGALDANARDTLNKLNELARALVSSPRR